MNTVHLARYRKGTGPRFTFVGRDRSEAFRGMRKLLLEYARQNELKRNWFDPEEVDVMEVVVGAGYLERTVILPKQ